MEKKFASAESTTDAGLGKLTKRYDYIKPPGFVRDIEGRKTAVPDMLLIASGIDYDPLPESEVEMSHVYRLGDKIKALTEQNIRDVLSLGFSVLQIPAGDFFNRDINPDGSADWRQLDENLRILARFNLKAVLGAGFYWIPQWMQSAPNVTPLCCLKHNETIPIFSLWSPFTYEWTEKCAAALANHLCKNIDRISGIQLSLCGDFGEAIFPAGMINAAHIPETENSNLHNHSDFWCNDSCARIDYIRFVRERYGLDFMTGHFVPGNPNLFPCANDNGPYPYAWVDFIEWYHESMTLYAKKVVEIFRRHFSDIDLVIWLGGGVEPHSHGQDNTALPKAMKSPKAVIRSTAAGSQMIAHQVLGTPETLAAAFQRNYPIVKRIATACKFYGVPLWLEPPYPPGLNGPAVVARIFEGISCGAAAHFDWTRTLQRQRSVYEKNIHLLRQHKSLVNVAVYFPLVSHYNSIDSFLPERYWNGAAHIRAITDFDVVDDRLICDGVLERYSILVLPQVDLLRKPVFDKMSRWVEAGGILIAQDCGPIRLIDSTDDDKRQWFGLSPKTKLSWGRIADTGVSDMPLPETVRKFRNQSVLVFDRLGRSASSVLDGSAGAAIVRCNRGRGFTLLCASGLDGTELFVTVLRDILTCIPETAGLAARRIVELTQGNGRLFATIFEDGILLANLSGESLTYAKGSDNRKIPPYSIEFLPVVVEQ